MLDIAARTDVLLLAATGRASCQAQHDTNSPRSPHLVMLLSRRAVESLNESDLRRKVLLPLFVAMGFREVTEYHGPQEFGKDLLMWKPDLIRSRQNYAVVAKASKINSRNNHEVLRQVQECFGKRYPDPVTGEEMRVTRVLVVSSKTISSHAKQSIRIQLGNRADQLDFIDGDILMQRVREFLSKELVWESLVQAHRVLAESFDETRFGMMLYPDGTSTVFVMDKPGVQELFQPLDVTIAPALPHTPEGARQREELVRFLQEGEAIELEGNRLGNIRLPEPMEALLADAKVNKVVLAPSPLDKPIICGLELLGAAGTRFALEYLHFTHVQGGTDGATLSNLGQPIPFKVKFRVNKKDKFKGSLSVNWNVASEPDALFFFRVTLLEQVLSEGAEVVFRDWATGVPIAREIILEPSPTCRPPDGALELSRRLAAIQLRTGTIFEVGNLDLTPGELADISRISQIVTLGVYIARGGVTLSLAEEKERGESRTLEPAAEARLSHQLNDDEVASVLGKEIHLGPCIVHYVGPISVVEDGHKGTELRIEASEEHPLVFEYPTWKPIRGST